MRNFIECVFLFFLVIFFIYMIMQRGVGDWEMGRRTACASNLKEFLKMLSLYEQNFGRGIPKETAGGNGTAQFKALLFGTWNGTDRSPGDAVLRSPKLFWCPSDDDVEKGEGDLNMLRITATMKNFHRYTSYVLAANNLNKPDPDQILMADDAEDGSNGNFWNGGRIGSADANADGSGSPGFNSYLGGNPVFYTHKEGGIVITGDNSVFFFPGIYGVTQEMWKGNPKLDVSVSCYY